MARYAVTEPGQNPYGETRDRFTTRSAAAQEFRERVAAGKRAILTVFWDGDKSEELDRSD